MRQGLVHIYCGDGKGKTTAAVGLAVRAMGRELRTMFVQFAKAGTSGEIEPLRKLGAEILHDKELRGWYKGLSEQQRGEAAREYEEMLEKAFGKAEKLDLLVLDEVMAACGHGVISTEKLAEYIRSRPTHLEVVLTGRNPPDELLELADYVSEIAKVRHPYDKGICAREGIER